MRYLPHNVIVNQEALDIVLRSAVARANELDNMDNGQADRARNELLDAMHKVESGMKWSRENRCSPCGGAGMGNDGDTWDKSDPCSCCGGIGIKIPEV